MRIMQSLVGRLQWVNIANYIGNGYIRRGKLFAIALGTVQPCNRCSITQFSYFLNRMIRDRIKWIVVYFAAFNNRYPLIEKFDKQTSDTRFGLPPKPEQNKVVLRKYGINDLRNDRIFISNNARKQRFAIPQLLNNITAEFVFYRKDLVTSKLKLTES